jgi:hypothetical protein
MVLVARVKEKKEANQTRSVKEEASVSLPKETRVPIPVTKAEK